MDLWNCVSLATAFLIGAFFALIIVIFDDAREISKIHDTTTSEDDNDGNDDDDDGEEEEDHQHSKTE